MDQPPTVPTQPQVPPPPPSQQFVPTVPESPKTHSSSKLPIVLVVVILLVIGVAGGWYFRNYQPTLFDQGSNLLPPPDPNVTIPVGEASVPSTSNSAELDEWKMVEHKGFPDSEVTPMKGFILHYPSDWKITKNEVSNEEPQGLQLVLTKGQSTISIRQGVGDAAGCLFPEDEPLDGMYVYYDEYEAYKKWDYQWRSAPLKDDPLTYTVCEQREDRFVGITSVGWISFNNKDDDEDLVEIFRDILVKLEIKN